MGRGRASALSLSLGLEKWVSLGWVAAFITTIHHARSRVACDGLTQGLSTYRYRVPIPHLGCSIELLCTLDQCIVSTLPLPLPTGAGVASRGQRRLCICMNSLCVCLSVISHLSVRPTSIS